MGYDLRHQRPIVVLMAIGFVALFLAAPGMARDPDGRYAAAPLHDWFDQLASGKGLCCAKYDGETVADADWDVKGGRYRVRIDSRWIDVPDDALITEPNRDGRTIVWPIRRNGEVVDIRCFMPGAMT
jgi:hypothetical protein